MELTLKKFEMMEERFTKSQQVLKAMTPKRGSVVTIENDITSLMKLTVSFPK